MKLQYNVWDGSCLYEMSHADIYNTCNRQVKQVLLSADHLKKDMSYIGYCGLGTTVY